MAKPKKKSMTAKLPEADTTPLVSAEEVEATPEHFKPIDPPVVETVPKPRKPRKPVPQDIKLSARQFCRARGYRWERCAGFLHEMKQLDHSSKTRPEWDQLWDAYWKRPVK